MKKKNHVVSDPQRGEIAGEGIWFPFLYVSLYLTSCRSATSYMDRAKLLDGRHDDLITEIYRAAFGQTSVSNALKVLADETASHKAFWSRIDLARGAAKIIHNFNVTPDFIRDYIGLSGDKNLWIRKHRFFEVEGRVWRGTEIVPARQLALGASYNRMLAREAIHHTLHLVVAVRGNEVMHVVLARKPAEPDYGKNEIQIAEDFSRHTRRALDFRCDLARHRMVETALSDALDDSGLGMAVIDPPRVIYASANFLAMLAPFSPSRIVHNGDLVRGVGDPGTDFPLPSELADAVNGHDGKSVAAVAIRHGNSNVRLIAQIRPYPLDGLLQGANRVALAITIYDPEQRLSINENLLMSAFDLTRSEAHVCALLATGKSAGQMARELRISEHTIRTHLQRVLKKTRSTRQAEVITLALRTAGRNAYPVQERRSSGEGSRSMANIHLRSSSRPRSRSLRTDQSRES